MPRIDPLQLLKCLAVLLNPDGGILSRDEVPRLVNLMTKFSKKLVSKCVYVLILKHTETSLVDMFMAEGGWALIQNWLQDASQGGNWNLVQEILELLLITPVDVERLKSNSLPKLIKNLSKREDLGEVAQLSVQIVQNWLIIVKSAHTPSATGTQQQSNNQKSTENNQLVSSEQQQQQREEINNKNVESSDSPENIENNLNTDQSISTTTFYKIALKDGKQIIKKLNPGETVEQINKNKTTIEDEINKKFTDNSSKNSSDINNSSKLNGDRSKLSTSSSSKSKSSSSSSTRDKDRKSSRNSSRSKSSSSISSSSRDKDRKDHRDRDKKDKRQRSSSKSSLKSDTNKDNKTRSDANPKEKQSEKDKDTLEKIKPQTLDKLGRIPKKVTSGSGSVELVDNKQKENQPKENLPEKKKPSFSILNRKAAGEERTKTVKVFNSKMRSTGLEEEAKPPPPRSARKSSTVSSSSSAVNLLSSPPVVAAKRLSSPPKEHSNNLAPPEKKLKIDKLDIGLSSSLSDRPGAIKLIPPKAKPAVLQESDMFMDALTASAPKKEAKKRKRRTSLTKDVAINETAPITESTSAPVSPSSVNSAAAATFGFYQDTINEMNIKNNDVEGSSSSSNRAEDADDDEQNADSNDTNFSGATPTDQDASLLEDEETSNSNNNKQPKLMDGSLKGVLVYTKKKGPKKSIKWKSDEDLVEIKFFELDETERVNVTKTFNDMAKMELNSEREAFIMSRKLPNEDNMEPQTAWRMPLFIVDQPAIAVIHGSKSIEKDIQLAREKTSLPALYFDKRRIPDNPEEAIPENHQISDPVIIPLEDPGGQEIDLRNTQWPEPKGSSAVPTIENATLNNHQIPSTIFPNIPFNSNNFNNISSTLPPNIPSSSSFVVPPNFSSIPPNLGPHHHHHHHQHPGSFTQNLMPNLNNLIGVVPPHHQLINQPDLLNTSGFNVPSGTDPGFIMNNNDPNNFAFNNNARPPNMMFNNNFNRGGISNNNNRGGFRRGGSSNSGPGGWVQMNGQRTNNNLNSNNNNNWNNNKRGGGGGGVNNNINGVRGGRMCKNIQNHGYCRNRDNCPFVH